MAEHPVIGFIGVGHMGHGMAKNILAGGYRLLVKGHRNRAPVEDLVSRGAEEAESAAAMAASCDIIHICLSNSPQVEAVIRGTGGILEGARAGLIVLDCTTSDPASTVALAEELAGAGATLVDAPLGRTPKEAEAGTLDAMVGAGPETFERILPVIRCWAENINRTGPVASAHRMKLITNFVSLGYAALYSEALTLAVKSDLSPQSVRDVLQGSRMRCGFFDTFMAYAVGRDREAHKFSLANAAKDVGYVASMASEAQVMNLMGAAIRQYYTHVTAKGASGDYVPMLSDHVAELNGTDLAAAVEAGARES